MKLPLTDLVVFLVYMAGIVLFGFSFYFRNRDSDQYTRGGGNLPSWAVAMSIFATFVSSISFLALPGKAYQSDWNAFVFSLSIPVAAWIAVKFFVPLYRSIGSISAYSYLESRFGRWARIYASLCYILTQIMRMGAILYLLALPLNALLGWNIILIVVVTGICVILYSMLGGIKAVIWTDTVQGIILIGGALTCAVILLLSMPEGPRQLFHIASLYHKFSPGSFGASLSESTFWVVLIYGLFINLQNYGIDQNYVQRYMTTSTEKKAKQSALFGSLLYIPVSLVFFFIGTALFAFYKAQPDLLPGYLRPAGAADKVFPYFIVNGLPSGLTGLLIASVFAAGMSTVSTSINGIATIIYSGYFRPLQKPGSSDRSSMGVLYVSSVLVGLTGAGVAVIMALLKIESALDVWWSLASVFSGGMLGLFLLGFFTRKVRKTGAAIGVTVGVLVICWLSLSPILFNQGGLLKFRSPFHTNLTIVIGTIVIFLTGFTVSRTIFRSTNKLKTDI